MTTTTTSLQSESAEDKPAMSVSTVEALPVKVENLRKPNEPEALIERDSERQWFPNIAFLGRAGAGKTTGAVYLAHNFGYARASFATLLKQIAHQLWGEGADSDRDKLQKLGVAVREIDSDAWANALFRDVSKMIGPVVIDDLRFPNEYWGLCQRGFVTIRVTADETARVDRLQKSGKFQSHEQLNHISETALDGEDTNYVIENEGDQGAYEQAIWDVLNRELRRV